MSLELICVGTGRDGTVTLTQLITQIFEKNNVLGTVGHEYHSVDFYNLFFEHCETGDEKILRRIKLLFQECPHKAIVGNGYASLLPIVKEVFPEIKLIHLKRKDKQAFIQSALKNQSLFPETYINYGSKDGIMRRTSAVQTGEMTQEEWDAHSLEERFDWYYNYTHALIESNHKIFAKYFEVATEELSEKEILKKLTKFVVQSCGSSKALWYKQPEAVRLNRHTYVSVDDFPKNYRPYGQWLFGKFDVKRVTSEETYFSDFALNAFISWQGYLLTGFANEVNPGAMASKKKIKNNINKMREVLNRRLKELDLLENYIKNK